MKYVTECIQSGWVSSEGPFVEKFEKKFSAIVNRKYGIAVSSGTAAIDIALEALQVKKGDEIILPSFTIISCVGQIIRSGATPVLVDSDKNTWNMDPKKIEEKITSRTKAIMIVHIYGLPADIEPILNIAKKHNLKVLEDAAEMHGQTYNGKPCGSFGDISTFSFYPNKLITTGEGGMVVTNNPELAQTSKSLRNLCFQPNNRFVHERLGWNYRITNIQAALGLAQLERLEEFVKRKRSIGKQYNKIFKSEKKLHLPLEKTTYAENIYWIYGLVLNDTIDLVASQIMEKLKAKGIESRPFFCPMHQQPILKKMHLFQNERYPVSDKMYKNGFYIPSGLKLSKQDIEIVGDAVLEVLR